MTLEIASFYLMTTMDEYDYLRMKLFKIPEENKKEFNLESITCNEWACIKIRK